EGSILSAAACIYLACNQSDSRRASSSTASHPGTKIHPQERPNFPTSNVASKSEWTNQIPSKFVICAIELVLYVLCKALLGRTYSCANRAPLVWIFSWRQGRRNLSNGSCKVAPPA
ncbi:hypothetical protein TWF217_004137, partial [Orbilia oligospora]